MDNVETKTTKLLIYCKSQLSSKNVNSMAGTLREAIDDISEIIQDSNKPTLNAPFITLNESLLKLSNPATNGNFADGFNIYNNDELIATQVITETSLNLASIFTENGTYTITAKCYGANMIESAASSSITYIIDDTGNYLTFESTDNKVFTLKTQNETANWDGTLEYSTDKTNWTTWAGEEIASVNNKLYLRGTNNTSIINSPSISAETLTHRFVLGGQSTAVQCNGNIENLLDYASVNIGVHPAMAPNCFLGLFKDNITLTAGPQLPAINLSEQCYLWLYRGCSNLTSTYDLPAMSVPSGAYSGMYWGCSALSTPPALPATTLANTAYSNMFYESGITTAPELPATTVPERGYFRMFYGCGLLTTPPALPATTLGNFCYLNMFQSSGITSAPALPAMELSGGCYYSMFQDCTSLTTPPALPATILTDNCYDAMFLNSGITSAPELPATTMAPYCYELMFSRCSALTTPPDLPATTLADNCYYGMFHESGITSAPTLPAMSVSPRAYNNMFQGCTSLTTAPELPATTLAESCYDGIFLDCINLTTAPELPATTLALGCYSSMFQGCTSLTLPPELPATTRAPACYAWMFLNCTSLIKTPALPILEVGESCYNQMFIGCSLLKFSTTQTDECPYMWRIPTSGTGSIGEDYEEENNKWNYNMISATGGTFTENPDINTIYYANFETPGVSNPVWAITQSYNEGGTVEINPLFGEVGENTYLKIQCDTGYTPTAVFNNTSITLTQNPILTNTYNATLTPIEGENRLTVTFYKQA